MREVIRSVGTNDQQQYAGIEHNNDHVFAYHVLVFDHDATEDLQLLNENIEILYKKWLIGEEAQFTLQPRQFTWDTQQEWPATFLSQKEKNESLTKKAQRHIQNHFSKNNSASFLSEIESLLEQLSQNQSLEKITELADKAKALDEKMRQASASTKNISFEQKWVEAGISHESYLDLKQKVNQFFEKVKEQRSNSYHIQYNIIAPKVEAAFAMSHNAENFVEARRELIAIQKELIAVPLERWQKNELMDRLRSAFTYINEKQDEWRSNEKERIEESAIVLDEKFSTIIPKALESSFEDGFQQLKALQEITNHSRLRKEQRDAFYVKLNEAFTSIKKKADEENESNYHLAQQEISVAVMSAENAELFKESRAILTDAQNRLKEIRLGRKQKDELFAKIKEAFKELNTKQDAYFSERKRENRSKLEDVLNNLKRALYRKEDGIEILYNARNNVESKKGLIKVPKNGTSDVLDQFNTRVEELTTKINDAEADMEKLRKKISKMEQELTEINSTKTSENS